MTRFEVGTSRFCLRACVAACALLIVGCNSNIDQPRAADTVTLTTPQEFAYPEAVVVSASAASADTVTLTTPQGFAYPDAVVATNDAFSIFSNASLIRDDGKLTLATNVGAADVVLQPSANVGTIVSTSIVRLQPKAEAHGDVTASMIDLQPGARIDGAKHTGVALTPFEAASFIVHYTAGNVAAVQVKPHQSYSASPGRYAALIADPNATLTLSGGDYFVDDLDLAPNSTLVLATDTSVRIFARTIGGWDGVTSFPKQGAELLVVQTGPGQLTIGAPFKGTFVGTGVDVSLAKGNHQGAIFAKSVKLDPHAILHYQPPNVLAPLVAGGSAGKCADLIRPPVGLTCLAADRAFQDAIARECSMPGESYCSIKLASWANVGYQLAAGAMVSGSFTPAQYLVVVRDRTAKRNAALTDPKLAAAICAGPDSDGDGVPDPLDKCPNTPELTATFADGCTNSTFPAAPSAADVKTVLDNMKLIANAHCAKAVNPIVSAGGFYYPGDPAQGSFIFAGRENNQPAGCPVWYFFDILEIKGDGTLNQEYSVAYLEGEAKVGLLRSASDPVKPWVVQFNPKPTDTGTRQLLGTAGGRVGVKFRVMAMNGAGLRSNWSDWKTTTCSDCDRMGFHCGGCP